jgi:hypothetical protein
MKDITDPRELEALDEAVKAAYFLERTSHKVYMDLGDLGMYVSQMVHAEVTNSGRRKAHLVDASSFVNTVYPSYFDELSLEKWDERLDVLIGQGVPKYLADKWHFAYLLHTGFLKEVQPRLAEEIHKEPPLLKGYFGHTLFKTILAVQIPISQTSIDTGMLHADLLCSDNHKISPDFKSVISKKSLYEAFQAANVNGLLKPELAETDLEKLETLLGHTLVSDQHL